MSLETVRPRDWAWLIAGIALVGLAWSGSLDRPSQDYVGASLLDAGIIYATARGINALVSALQGTELDMWLVTFSIGELLDPINDVIERFSGVMTLAIASLVIQQLLLTIVSDATFSIALTALAVAATMSSCPTPPVPSTGRCRPSTAIWRRWTGPSGEKASASAPISPGSLNRWSRNLTTSCPAPCHCWEQCC